MPKLKGLRSEELKNLENIRNEDGVNVRAKRIQNGLLWFVSSLFFAALAAGFFTLIQLHRDSQTISPHPLVGNKPSTVAALKENGLPFSFLTIGDLHNSQQASVLIQKALKEGKASFLVILGDFVSHPDIQDHRYFLKKMMGDINPSIPVFVVSGNHDVDYPLVETKKNERRVTPEVYESLYGSRNFDFIFNDCLFILCGIDPRNPITYLNYLRDTLSRKGKEKRHIFVFIHNPPKGVGIPASFALPNQEEFFSLLETYKVTTCFFGDFHSYWRGQRKGTALIVSGGGGGALKKWQPIWGKFHHLLKITIDENMVSEGIMISGAEGNNLRKPFKKWIFIHLFPMLPNSIWIVYMSFFILITLAGFFCLKFLKVIRHS